jgi:hypothetical protein
MVLIGQQGDFLNEPAHIPTTHLKQSLALIPDPLIVQDFQKRVDTINNYAAGSPGAA